MMIDITGPKVLIPTVLFALLSPGLILALPAGQPRTVQLLLHALVLTLVYWVVAKFIVKVNLTKADLIVPAVLFVLLTPGVLLTLPAGPSGRVWMSGEYGPVSTLVHAVVFAIVFATLRKTFPKYY